MPCDEDPSVEDDGISGYQLKEVCLGSPAAVPLDAQQAAEQEGADWGHEWQVGSRYREPAWPAVIGQPPDKLVKWAICRACLSFACGTGLGWDALHPRALLRRSDQLLDLLCELFALCELLGCWPTAVSIIIVVLLPKPEGGFRPIGLLPLLPRLWMRARREVATEWGRANPRPYLYAGQSMGAHVAA